MESDFVIAVNGDLVEVTIPGFARVDPELLARLSSEHVPGAFDVGGGERLAVMPFDALAEREPQPSPIIAPRPAGREVGYDRLEAVLRYVLVEDDKIVEDRHHRPLGRKGRFLVDRQAGRAVPSRYPENPSLLLR